MAEQEKKQGQNLSEDAWRRAISSWKSRATDTDFDELDSPMTADIMEKLHGKRETPKES